MDGEQPMRVDMALAQCWYCAVEEQTYSHDLGYYRTHGIQIIGNAEGEWRILDKLHDVTVDRSAAEQMAALFTRLQLSPVHFRDAVTDILS